MDPQIQALTTRLAELTLRNSVGAVGDRIQRSRAHKRDEETINELMEIINDLQADKSELVRIAQAYEEDVAAQRISQENLAYITENLLPVIREISAAQGGDQTFVDNIEPMLSLETVTVLQLLGFNLRRGLGEPLTELLARFILSKVPAPPAQAAELQRLVLERDIAMAGLARDPEATARLKDLYGRE
jgi:hypothetical protein